MSENNNQVRAKFKVSEITRRAEYGSPKEVQIIKLHPVTNNSEENKKFYAYTPCGQIELGTVNADAAKLFDLNCEYYVDFTKAE